VFILFEDGGGLTVLSLLGSKKKKTTTPKNRHLITVPSTHRYNGFEATLKTERQKNLQNAKGDPLLQRSPEWGPEEDYREGMRKKKRLI
jgi:hypothetical protein